MLYRRLLLYAVKSPIYFEDLRTVNATICDTYKQACQLRGLLEDDTHWNSTLEKAAAARSPWMLQNLFAIMLQTCAMSNPQQLWDNHKKNLAEDILHHAQVQNPNLELDTVMPSSIKLS